MRQRVIIIVHSKVWCMVERKKLRNKSEKCDKWNEKRKIKKNKVKKNERYMFILIHCNSRVTKSYNIYIINFHKFFNVTSFSLF